MAQLGLARQSSEHERAARLRAEREREAVDAEGAAVDSELQRTLSSIAALEAAEKVPEAGAVVRDEHHEADEADEAAEAERRVAAVRAFVLAEFGAEDGEGYPSWTPRHLAGGLFINLRELDSGDAKCIALCDRLPEVKHTLTRLCLNSNDLTDKFGPALIAVLPQLTKLKALSICESPPPRGLSVKMLVAIGAAAPRGCSVDCYNHEAHAAILRLRPCSVMHDAFGCGVCMALRDAAEEAEAEAEAEGEARSSGWNAYIDNLKATGQCEDGCIVGHDGAVWTPGGLAITQAEAGAIIDHFRKFGEPVDETRLRRIPGTEEYGYPHRDAEGRLQWRLEEEGLPPPTAVTGLRGGIVVAGKKFVFLRNDEEMMCGKAGQGGICIFKTAQALIMGTYNQDMPPAMNTMEVGKMAVSKPHRAGAHVPTRTRLLPASHFVAR